MPIFDFSGQPGAANGPAPKPGWSLNPLTDATKVTSGLGDWINQHTGIGNFNPGIGSAVSAIGGIIPGLANLGIAAATPWNETSQTRLEQAGQGLVHGVEDTATDVLTAGGTIPGWTGAVKDTIGALPGSYTPSTLKDYSTEKGGPGLLGGALNDFANLAVGAGGLAKVAGAGELGEAAGAAASADKTAQLAAAAGGGLPGDVADAGQAARLQSATEAAQGKTFAPEDVLGRAHLLDRLNTFRQGVDYAFNPLRAWGALGAPLGRAAVLDAVPEAGLDTQAARDAHFGTETPQAATQPVSEHVASEVPVKTAPDPDPLQRAMDEMVADQNAKEAAATGATAATEPAPGMVRLFRGQPLDPNVPVGTDSWSLTLAEAESHARATGGQVLATDVPEAVAAQAHTAAQQAGDFGTNDTVHHLPPEYADAARPISTGQPVQEPAMVGAAPGGVGAEASQVAGRGNGDTALPENAPASAAAPGGAPATEQGQATTVRGRDLGPKEAQINLARAKQTPEWAEKVVSYLPEGAKKLLRAMEYRTQGHQIAGVIQEAERTLRMKAAAELREPWFQAHISLAHELIGQEDTMGEKISPDQADRIVGERVRAAMTAGPAWHAMEELAPTLNAIEPNAVEKAFGFRGRLTEAQNTPEFRAAVQNVADLASAHLEGRGEFAATSPYLGVRGMEGVENNEASMTKGQQADLKKAVQARIQAHELQPQIAEEVAQTQAQIEAAHGTAEKSAQAMGAARSQMADASNRIVENRYGPRIAEDETGKVVPGEPANANLTEKQMVGTGTGRTGETPQQVYRRAIDAEKALQDYQEGQANERAAYATMLEAHKSVADLQDQLSNASLPSQVAASALHGKSDALLARLHDQMNNAPVNRVPPIYQPITRAALEIARLSKEHPELADVLAEVPQNFADAVRYSADHGFDPTHVSEMTEEKARKFATATGMLSPDLGKQEIGMFRKGRTGVLATAGLDSRTAAGMAAQWASVWHEDRVNAIADTVDRLYAVPAAKNEFGERINPNPRDLVAWDAQRRGLMATVRPETGEQQAIQAQYFIPKAVARTIDAYSKDHSNMLQRALAKTTDPWRALVLTASPKFYVNHMIGHIVLGAVQGVSLKQWAQAWGEARGGFANYPELAKSGITQGDIGNEGLVGYGDIPAAGAGIRARAASVAQGVGAARAGGGIMGAVHEFQSRVNNAVNTVDAFSKAALAIRGEAKGLTRDEALHFAQQAGVDYSALSPFERQVVRSVIPFYSFEKGVLKIVMQYPLDHPIAANMLMQTGRLQQHWAVDSHGNPLPTNYQDVINLPGLGPVNLKNLTPFKDVGSLVTATGLTNSLQFVVQAAVRSGLGVAAPGVKAGVKVGPTGQLIPDVPFAPSILNALNTTPQGSLVSGLGSNPAQAAENFFGLPAVKQATLDNAGQRAALASGETTLPISAQNKATAFPVDTNLLQNQLAAEAAASPTNPLAPPTTPGQAPATSSTPTTDQVQAALTAAQTKQQAAASASAAAKKAAGTAVRRPSKPKAKGGGGSKPRSSSRGSKGTSSRARTVSIKSGGSGKALGSGKVRAKLSQGFGKATNAHRKSGGHHAHALFKSATKGVPKA